MAYNINVRVNVLAMGNILTAPNMVTKISAPQILVVNKMPVVAVGPKVRRKHIMWA